MYKFNYKESYVYNPEKVKEGYRLLDEYLARAFLRKKASEQKEP